MIGMRKVVGNWINGKPVHLICAKRGNEEVIFKRVEEDLMWLCRCATVCGDVHRVDDLELVKLGKGDSSDEVVAARCQC